MLLSVQKYLDMIAINTCNKQNFHHLFYNVEIDFFPQKYKLSIIWEYGKPGMPEQPGTAKFLRKGSRAEFNLQLGTNE